MWNALAKIMLEKQLAQKTLSKKIGAASSVIPGYDKINDIQDNISSGQQNFMDKNIPQLGQLQDFPYKLKAGMANNLGMPMDAFMTDNDFQRTGTQLPNQSNNGYGMMNQMRSLYGGGFGR